MGNIKIMDNGPLFVSGDVEIVDGEGNKMETKDQFALCRCGLSNNKPFCDGSHQGKFESNVRA
jgi:CDGSH-type Zn-finger protein